MKPTRILSTGLLGATALATGLALPAGASAQTDDELRAQTAALAKQIEQLNARLEEIQNQIATNKSEIAENKSPVVIDPKKLKISSADGRFSLQFGGRAQFDAAFFDDDKTDIGDGAEIRRLRLFAAGKMYGDFNYKVQINFDTSRDITINDAYVAYTGFKPVTLEVGNFKAPYSLAELTSSKYLTFMERASIVDAFTLGRRLGVEAKAGGGNYSLAAGFFNEDTDSGGASPADWALAGRASYAPIAEDGRVLHFGLGVAYESVDNAGITFEATESHIQQDLVDTGALDQAQSVILVNPEFALVYDSFSLQAEYMNASLDQGANPAGIDQPEPDFAGWYVYGSWFVTGEHRNYKAKTGSFGRTDATDGLELGVRYSTIDLSEDGISGGEMDNVTLAANYYVNPHVVFRLNYLFENVDAAATSGLDETINAVQARFQLDF